MTHSQNFDSDAPTRSKPAPEEATQKTDSKVETELNKGKAMKSIFSHLVNTEDKANRVTSDNGKKPVSFSVKSSNKPKEFKSIFSHLEGEQGSSQPSRVAMETDKPINKQPAIGQQPISSQQVTVSSEEPKANKITELVQKSNVGEFIYIIICT